MEMRKILALLLLTTLFGLVAPSVQSAEQGFRVIVNTDNPVHQASRDFVSKAFLKKVREWPNGQVIRPADLDDSSRVRSAFSRSVLKRSVLAVKRYWQQAIFSGRDIPPPELETEVAAVRFVQRNSGGVAYVSTSANVEGVKVLSID
jgi:hypothetical protein